MSEASDSTSLRGAVALGTRGQGHTQREGSVTWGRAEAGPGFAGPSHWGRDLPPSRQRGGLTLRVLERNSVTEQKPRRVGSLGNTFFAFPSISEMETSLVYNVFSPKKEELQEQKEKKKVRKGNKRNLGKIL